MALDWGASARVARQPSLGLAMGSHRERIVSALSLSCWLYQASSFAARARASLPECMMCMPQCVLVLYVFLPDEFKKREMRTRDSCRKALVCIIGGTAARRAIALRG